VDDIAQVDESDSYGVFVWLLPDPVSLLLVNVDDQPESELDPDVDEDV
jgi:hypothetical protein